MQFRSSRISTKNYQKTQHQKEKYNVSTPSTIIPSQLVDWFNVFALDHDRFFLKKLYNNVVSNIMQLQLFKKPTGTLCYLYKPFIIIEYILCPIECNYHNSLRNLQRYHVIYINSWDHRMYLS